MKKFKKHNDEVLKIVERNTLSWDDNFDFLEKDVPDNKEILDMYDAYNDGEASKRIVNEMEKL